jgi:TRAP-type C4-dicarboxylate transport system permease large subunit
LLSGPEQVLVQFFNAVANLLHREFTRSEVFGDLLKSTIALFVVLNPIGTVPLFVAITQNMKKEERKTVSKTAIITSGIVLVVFAIAGTGILLVVSQVKYKLSNPIKDCINSLWALYSVNNKIMRPCIFNNTYERQQHNTTTSSTVIRTEEDSI